MEAVVAEFFFAVPAAVAVESSTTVPALHWKTT
jgi:hypothetical protein